MKILLLSDTHGHLDERILDYCQTVDEIWHAGDFGNLKISDTLSSIKPLRGVYGNIDGHEVRKVHPETQNFSIEGLKVFMIHIGGYPGHFPGEVRGLIKIHRPAIFICGHSHILRVMRDPSYNSMICLNPGAAGRSGFHVMRTMIRMELNDGKVTNLEAIELGKRSSEKPL